MAAAAALASSHAFAFEEDSPLEASFSSYMISSTSGGLSLRLSGEFTRNGISAPIVTGLGNSMIKKKKEADADSSELDVFSAEKYFSGSMDGDEQLVTKPEKKSWKSSSSPAKEVAFPSRRTSSSGAPSAASDTSGHSRAGTLLQGAKKGLSQSPHKPTPTAGGMKFLSIFLCSCVNNSCRETHGRRKPVSWPETGCNGETGTQRADKLGSSFSPRIEYYSDIPPALSPVVVGNSIVGEELFEEERKGRGTPSADVLRSPASMGKASSGLRRSLTMSAPFSSVAARDSDVCSESSSELFELDHLASGRRPFGMGGASAMLCYEPSEASIEWSVVTASAVNFSLVSDGERTPTWAWKAKAPRQHRQQRPGGLLLRCVGDKAVGISPNTCKHLESTEAADRKSVQQVHGCRIAGNPVSHREPAAGGF